MKAVNLVPREAQRSFGALRSLGAGTTALFGALGIARARRPSACGQS